MDAPGDGVIHIGEIIFGRYRIESELGRGNAATVYLVTNINLNTVRALKCISKDGLTDTMVREADILKNLRHPAVPIIYDIEENEQCICIIEEFADGLSLKSHLLQHNFSIKEALEIILQLCSAVEYLHGKEIFHHDIKPGNIIYHNGRIKLLDYGNSVRAELGSSTGMGTKWYAAPEVYESLAGAGSDIYAIGVLLLELITGGRDTDNLNKIDLLPVRLLIDKCLFHNEKKRYASVRELGRAVNQLLKCSSIYDNNTRTIAFVGAEAHCGTTHTARMAAHYCQSRNRTVLAERNQSGHFMKIICAGSSVRFRRGVFEADGLFMIPYYESESVSVADEGFSIRILDYGVYDRHFFERITAADIVCIVGDISPQHVDDVKKVLEDFENTDIKVYTLCNMAAASYMKQAFKTDGIVNPIRVPYMPRPEKCRKLKHIKRSIPVY